MPRSIRLFGLSLLFALAVPLTAHAAGPEFVSFRKPDGLILSTGNLFFTSHAASTASVWRAAQGSIPGQEILLYSEPDAIFGDIVFAQVGGTFFGYFFAQKANVITIKRVPLTGGAAIVLATVTNVDIVNSHRNLATDGVNLYWQDVNSVRKMPIGGGASTVLDASRPNTPTAGIALQNGNVIYASVQDIRFVPTGGATTSPAVRTIATASSRVTALFADASGVFWGEQSGAVRTKSGSATIKTLSTTPAIVPTSISPTAWTRCGSQSCLLQVMRGFPPLTVTETVRPDALGVAVSSGRRVFWGDAAGVHRQVF